MMTDSLEKLAFTSLLFTCIVASLTSPAAAEGDNWTIEGIVVDSNGAGIVGAKVRVELLEEGKEPVLLGETKTQRTGDIAMRVPKPAHNRLRVRITKTGFKDYEAAWEPDLEQASAFIDATLAGLGGLSGQVTSLATGKPVSGVLVNCAYGASAQSVRTDDAGRYDFEGLAGGEAMLLFEMPGFGLEKRPVSLDVPSASLNVVLSSERPVLLIFEDGSGKRYPHVVFDVSIEPGQHAMVGTTDEQGVAKLSGVHRMSKRLRIRFGDAQLVRPVGGAIVIDLPVPASSPADDPGEVKRTVPVRAAASIAGRVTDAGSSKPIVGVRVVVGTVFRPDMPMTWTDRAGEFTLGGLEPGFSTITLQHTDYATEVCERRLAVGRQTRIEIGLQKGRALEGLVVDEQNAPLGGVAVAAETWRGHSTLGLRALTSEDGKFAFPHMPADGELLFSFAKPGYERQAAVRLAAGKHDHRVVLAKAKRPDTASAEGLAGKIAIGEKVPDLRVRTLDGKVLQLSELQGKYVFVECWASWCSPCRREIPHLKKLHEKVRERSDFVMIGLSLDRSQADLEAAVKSNGIEWAQAFGPGSGAEEVFEVLGGAGIPYNCLIGTDGRILAQSLRGEALVPAVEQLAPPVTSPAKSP